HDRGFDANRIISEDAAGFVMSHGDHNHYFFKKDLTPEQIKAAQKEGYIASVEKVPVQATTATDEDYEYVVKYTAIQK
ncbi:hypothetical protein D065_11247, partial [Streptococcus mitis 13/39]